MTQTTVNDSGITDYGYDPEAHLYEAEYKGVKWRFGMFSLNMHDQVRHFPHPHISQQTGVLMPFCDPHLTLRYLPVWPNDAVTLCQTCLQLANEFAVQLWENSQH